MTELYFVRLTKDYLVFSAGHFITYNGGTCERLHGHNYRLTAEVEGPLDENHYVVDFVALRERLRELVLELDHHMLLPTGHPQIHVRAGEQSVVVTFEDRRWEFPCCDCVLLPIPNTTTELLARYLGQRLWQEMLSKLPRLPDRLRIEIDECDGQIGVYEFRPDG